MKNYKLRIYKKNGPDKGNLEREEFFQTKEEMLDRYHALFRYNQFSLNPTAWQIFSQEEKCNWEKIPEEELW